MKILTEDELKKISASIRRQIVTTVSLARAGHPGGSLSCVDILVCLYFHILRNDPSNPGWEQRDRFILSKGHAASALYAVLAEKGYFSKDLLTTFGQINSRLQVHPDMRKIPGIDMSTGALGQGLSVGAGAALGAKLDKKDIRIYVLLGDGECQEGQVWEAAMAASHYKLNNLTALIDYNNVQLLGTIPEIMEVAPLADKWKSFGWNIIEINGHSHKEIIKALETAGEIKEKPTAVIARTVKGKGVSFMEGKSAWHGRPLDQEELETALKELSKYE